MSQGFISLHRKLMDNPIWSDANYVKLWVYCLFKASHQEHDQLVGNQIVKLQRGQFVIGRFSLAEDMNKGVKRNQQLNEKTWWRHLKNLETWQMLTITSTNKYSLVTIDKYDVYQDVFNKNVQQNDQQMSNSCPSNDQQMSTNNNVNNANKKNRSQKQVYDDSSIYYQLACFFLEQIRGNNQDYKTPNLQTWSNDIRKMMEMDKRTEEQVRYLMKWVQQDEFEMVNVLSPSKLRSRFDQLVLKVKRQKSVTPIETKRPKENIEHIDFMKQMHGGD